MTSHNTLSFLANDVRSHDRDRFVLTLLAPAEKREGLFSLYAFDREIAHVKYVVAEPALRLIRLQWWRDTLDSIYDQGRGDHPVAEGLAGAIRAYDLPRWPFDRLIDQRQAELETNAPADLAEFERWAEGTGLPVLSLALDVLAVHDEEVLRASRHVGIAWGMISILRSLANDAAAGRATLPSELVRKAGGEADLVERGVDGNFLASTIKPIVDAAATHIANARQRRAQIPDGAIPVLLTASIAETYLNRLRRAGYDVFAPGWRQTRPRPVIWSWRAWRRLY